jgi:lysyl-tRNA synthetase class 2
MDRRGYVEVETPILQVVHGGAAARPFVTHLNAFGLDVSLRIATELYLKRAIVGGIDRVYELGRTFRNEGVDSTHSPEFSLLEAYGAFEDYDSMAELTRAIVLDAAETVHTMAPTTADGVKIELTDKWREAAIHDLVSDAVGESITPDTNAEQLRAIAETCGVSVDPRALAGEIVLELYEKLVEHTLIQPTFVRDYPVEVRPLARPHRTDPRLAEAWDLVIGGVEVAVAYSELADPVEQRRRLIEQAAAAAGGDPEAMHLDEDFLRALEYGMPPTGGMGLGVDRLLMTLTGKGIRETILFPTVKPL